MKITAKMPSLILLLGLQLTFASTLFSQSAPSGSASNLPSSASLLPGPATGMEATANIPRGWWNEAVPNPLREETTTLPLGIEQVLMDALTHSQQVKVFSELPLIRETAIIEADAAFDWSAFLEGRWNDYSDPIGNTLTAGAGIRRFHDHQATGNAGVKRRLHSGGTVDLSQQFGFQDNNSDFFVPDQQGSARLSLNFTQPLLRGHGKRYNCSLVVLAKIDKCAADAEFRRQLQSHLLEVARGYWSLYLERAVLYQKINSYVRGKNVHDQLVARRDLDAQQSQIISAAASLKQRESELLRARASVLNAESRLRSLVNAPAYHNAELITTDSPSFQFVPSDLNESVSIAFRERPEVTQSLKRIRAACVRMDMTKNELLPQLNLLISAYVAGLKEEGDTPGAWSRQFDTGQPGYSAGLQFETPLYNRAAKARHARRKLELRQLRSQYATTLETIRLEVEVAVRELQTSYQELSTKYAALEARKAHLNALEKRWASLAGDNVTASLALENLLMSQERLAGSEFEYVKAQLTFNLAQINLKKATGTLLQHENVLIGRACDCNLPMQVVEKVGSATSPAIGPTFTESELHLPPPTTATPPSAAIQPLPLPSVAP